MEATHTNSINKGGRPPKKIKRDQHVTFKCSLLERKIMERKARSIYLTLSEYLRDLGLKGNVNIRIKTLPREDLELRAELYHLASSLNQIALRHNRGDVLSPLERINLNRLAEEIRSLAGQIKSYLQ